MTSPGSFQRHHLLPRALARRAQFAALFRSVSGHGLSIHGEANLLPLPADEATAAARGLALHRGPHPAYSEVVAARVERIRVGAEGRPEAAARRLARLQRALTRTLTGHGPRLLLLNRRDPMHLFADYGVLDAAIEAMFRD